MSAGRRAGLFFLIRSDLLAKAGWLYGDTTPRSVVKTILTDGTFAMLVYRLMQASQDLGLTPFSMVFNKLNGTLGGCII